MRDENGVSINYNIKIFNDKDIYLYIFKLNLFIIYTEMPQS